MSAVYGHVIRSKIRQIPRHDLSCSKRLEDENKARKKARKPEFTGSESHTLSCTVCQIFLAVQKLQRMRVLPMHILLTQKRFAAKERNGVAIDRVYGSVAHGPFNFEVLTTGEFTNNNYRKKFHNSTTCAHRPCHP